MSETSVETGQQTNARHECPVNGGFDALLSRIQSPALREVATLWHAARGDRQMPSWTDIASPALSPYSKLLWSYAYDPETGEFTGRSAGRFNKWVGENFSGRRLKELYPLPIYQEAHQYLTRIVTIPLAHRSSGCLFKVEDLVVTGERIVLPLAGDGNTVNGVLGASAYVSPPLLGPLEMVFENMEWYAI